MKWNNHSNLIGEHAFLSASQYHWLNYDDDKLAATYRNKLAVEHGTRLHAFAAEAISLGIKLPSKSHKTLNLFVNDAIGYKMSPEVVLYYSPYCFGTADAISFNNNYLRISDLKTGQTLAHMDQLMIYAALFCLEYRKKPAELDGIELRIYQYDEYTVLNPEPDLITHIMDKIISNDKILSKINEEER